MTDVAPSGSLTGAGDDANKKPPRPYGRWWLALAAVCGLFGVLIAHFVLRNRPDYNVWPLVKWFAIGWGVSVGVVVAIVVPTVIMYDPDIPYGPGY